MPAIYGTYYGDTLVGTAGDDTIYGNGGADSISGGQGNDMLQADSGNSTIVGGEGDDKIYSNGGSSLFGGIGNDDIYVDRSDTVSGGTGNDIFHFPALPNYQYGNTGVYASIIDFDVNADKIDLAKFGISDSHGVASFATVQQLMQDVTYRGKTGAVITVGYIGGNVQLFLENVSSSQLSATNFLTTGAAGNAEITTSYGNVTDYFGSTGANKITGTTSSERLFGDAGDDTLNGGGGNDTLAGGQGNDLFIYDGQGRSVILDFQQGADRVDLTAYGVQDFATLQSIMSANGDGAVISLRGVSGTTSLVLNIAPSKLTAGDFIFAPAGGGVRIVGGYRDDDLFGGSSADTINGGSGNDFIMAAAGDDHILASSGNDTLVAGAGKDILVIIEGTSYGAPGKTYFKDFTQGVDKIDLRTSGIASLEMLKALYVRPTGLENVNSQFTVALPNGNDVTLLLGIGVDQLTSSDFIFADDPRPRLLRGETYYSRDVYGGLGNDTITSRPYGRMFGDAGDDLLIGNYSDTLIGGAGNDIFRPTLNTTYSGTTLVADFTQGQDRIDLSATGIRDFATLTTILTEDARAGRTSFLAAAIDIGRPISSLKAADFIFAADIPGQVLYPAYSISAPGGRAVQPIVGGAGADLIYGSTGMEWLIGGEGNDILVASGQRDTLVGGAGSDIFVLSVGNYGARILDFTSGVDKIDLTGSNITSFDILQSIWRIIRINDVDFIQVPHENNVYFNYSFELSAKVSDIKASDFIFNTPTAAMSLRQSELGVVYLYGGTGNDTLEGADTAQILAGGAGDDRFVLGANPGRDTLIGGAGTDMAVFSGTASRYTVKTVNNITTVTGTIGYPDGPVTLTQVEKLVFSDQTIDVSAGTVPLLSLTGGAIREGQAGKIDLAFTVSLSSVPTSDVSFTFSAQINSAGTAASTDFVVQQQTVTIRAGTGSTTLLVSVNGDTAVEGNETVIGKVSGLSGALYANGGTEAYAVGTVVNDDFQAGFSLDAYRAMNGTLSADILASDTATILNYMTFGRTSGRAASGFDAEAYAAFNPDIYTTHGLNSTALVQHYINFGKQEGRIAEGFDAVAYAALNPDLFAAFGLNHKALVEHFITSGRAEGRASAGFDAEAYAALNPDLFTAFGLDENALVSHYINSGRAEGRNTIGFSAEAYAALNTDLYVAFGLDHLALVRHYVNSGHNEGRLAYNVTTAGLTPTAPLDLLALPPATDISALL